ncbi:MAG: hypothetical protein FWD74_10905, partial [Actinomycetia bacterium]|nr:hypothetical protein [Actinomycetes bacterium]
MTLTVAAPPCLDSGEPGSGEPGSRESDHRELDPRDPELRLGKLLDPGSVVPLHPRDDSGVLAARGRIGGAPVTAFCTDALVMGGAMGAVGCARIVAAIDTAVREGSAVVGVWHC